jgi:F0F1-type ATP synthase epsilon subunit
MKLSIYSIKQTLLATDAERVTLPTSQGQITILDHHLPMITLVNAGNVAYYTSQNQWQEIAFAGGIAEIRPGSELVLLARQ